MSGQEVMVRGSVHHVLTLCNYPNPASTASSSALLISYCAQTWRVRVCILRVTAPATAHQARPGWQNKPGLS